MKSFPMFLKTSNRNIIVAGCGEQAAQKCRLLLKTDVKITVFGDKPCTEITKWFQEGRIQLHQGPIAQDSFRGAVAGFIATGCPATDHCLHDLAKQAGILVNVVDRPDLCDLLTPAIVDRDPIVIAIGTEGTAPVLARRIKTQLERSLDPRLGQFAARTGALRDKVARRIPQHSRRAFWQEVFDGAIWQKFRRGEKERAIADLNALIETGAKPIERGAISIIDTSRAAPDLLSLRAVARLQDADVIFYQERPEDGVLERARRDAERVHLPQDLPLEIKIETIFKAADSGAKLVLLSDMADENLQRLAASLANLPELDVEYMKSAHCAPILPKHAQARESLCPAQLP